MSETIATVELEREPTVTEKVIERYNKIASQYFPMLSTGAMLSLSTACASVGGVQDPGSLARAETAFAETMRARDFQRFAAFIADDAVFINGGKPLRGKPAIIEVRMNPEQVTNRATIAELRAQAQK